MYPKNYCHSPPNWPHTADLDMESNSVVVSPRHCTPPTSSRNAGDSLAQGLQLPTHPDGPLAAPYFSIAKQILANLEQSPDNPKGPTITMD